MIGRCLAVLLVVAPSSAGCGGPAGSADARQAPAPRGVCDAAQSQAELSACWTEEAARVRQRIAAAQESLAAAFSGDAEMSAAIARAQQEWAEYRDAQCGTFAQLAAGGSSEQLERTVCEARLGSEREAELARLSRDAPR